MPKALLWEAVAVSCECPTTAGLGAALTYREVGNKLRIAEASLGTDLPVLSLPSPSYNGDLSYATVSLIEFASFAKRKGWTLPQRFPVDPVNWNRWGRRDTAEVWQAAALAFLVSPDEASFEDAMAGFSEDVRDCIHVAMDGMRSGSLEVEDEFEWPSESNAQLSWHLGEAPPKERNRVRLDKFATWALGKGYALPARFPRENVPEQASSSDTWPWGSYSTPLLDHLAAAVSHFWAKLDPKSKTPPVQKQVRAWLEERGVNTRDATDIAKIINRPKGK